MALPTPPPYSNPIPNNPFYSPLQFYVQGPYSPLIVGSGLFIDYADGTINSTGGGGGVASIIAGAGIGVSSGTGNVTITNNGVRTLTAGGGINITGTATNPTISSTATGTVTQVNTGAGLTGGPITSTGFVSLSPSGVAAGSYSIPSITVDTYGRITSASSGSAVTSVTASGPLSSSGGLTPNIAISAATTLASGVVQLTDSVTSSSSSLAATALAVKTAFDAASAAIPKSCITNKGALISGTSSSVPATLSVGADGLVLTACSTAPTGLCWAPASGGSGGTVTSVTAGSGLTGGTITSSGTISLNSACILAPSLLTQKGDILSASAPSTPVILPLGSNGQFLTVDSTTPSGLKWSTECFVNDSTYFAKGAIVAGTGVGTYSALAVGSDNQFLVACSTATQGVCWTTAAATPSKLGVVYGCTTETVLRNVSLGCGALDGGPNLRSDSTAIGHYAGALGGSCLVGTYSSNTFVGTCSGYFLEDGTGNVGVGHCSFTGITQGNHNIAIGSCAIRTGPGFGNPPAIFSNIAIGTCALFATCGDRNIAIGYEAGCAQNNTSCNNVVIGHGMNVPVPAQGCQLAIGTTTSLPNTITWLTGCSTGAIRPGAGIVDCAASCGTSNMVLTSQGNAIQWKTAQSVFPAPYYLNALSTATQTATAINTGKAVLASSVGTNAIIIAPATGVISFTNSGLYNLQFSLQIISTGGGGGDVEVWLVKNGTAVANSNTRFSVKNVNEAEFAALNYLIPVAGADQYQLYWATDNLNIQLPALASTMGGPAIPSAIITVVPVGANG